MKKFLLDLIVKSNTRIHSDFALIRLIAPDGWLPPVEPGQFVQVNIPDCKTAFLRRPISICDYSRQEGYLDLMVRGAGEGTRSLIEIEPGRKLNLLLPLGKGFTTDDVAPSSRVLLVGGGVGVAPLVYLGRRFHDMGLQPHFLLGARSADQLLMLDTFRSLGIVHLSTDDATAGHPGVVTQNPVIADPGAEFDFIYCCGPMPMMKAVADIARQRLISCEVSLENHMACGMGACLCCVEKTVKGNLCVCTEGPVFNINQLLW